MSDHAYSAGLHHAVTALAARSDCTPHSLFRSNITPSLTDRLRKMTGGGGMGSSGSVRGGGDSYVPKSAKVNSEVNHLLGEVKEALSDGDLRFRSGVTMQRGSDIL